MKPPPFRDLARRLPAFARVSSFAPAMAVLMLAGCGTYEPPQPGIHTPPGQPRAQLRCEYGAPTGMVISRWNCRDTASMDEEARQAREVLERLPPPQPREF